MAGAHTARGGQPTPTDRGPRSRRDLRPVGVGWWQTPRRRGAVTDRLRDPSRHRVPDVTVIIPAQASRPPRPRSPLRPELEARRRRRRTRRVLVGAAAAVVLGPVLAFVVGYLVFTVPNPDDAVNNQVALVSFADGSPLTRLVPAEGNRVKVALETVPVHVRDAVLAAEDRSFSSNPGFDLTGIVRAGWNQLRGGSGGGSTITKQFVKKALVGDDQTLWRKYKEVVLAVKISQERTKDQILGDYLNTIYFGRGAYGIQSAAQAYFRKNVADLTPSEGALLAGLIQSPSRWDPAINPERATERWNFVLDGMVAEGWLDAGLRRGAEFPATAERRPAAGGMPDDNRGHIVTAVRAELEELGISEQDLAQEGLRISTTIDPDRQREAVDAAHEGLAGQPVNLRSATVAIDPATGGVLAYYGGDSGLGLDYARARRLAGSTFKPFVVLAGLLRDPPVGLGETFDGREVPGLRNAAGADCDRCDLKQAMTVSNNVVFHSLAKEVGPEAVARAAQAAGITAPLADPTEGIALGNKEVSAFELASAYATIAAGGVWHPPHLLASVVTADGRVLYQAAPQAERRFSERVARNVTEAMLDVAARDGLALPGGRPVAAKTGTVQSRFEGENNDAWMAGFTPMLSASVWMGTDMNSPIRTAAGTPIKGGNLPGDVWQQFMAGAHDGEPVAGFAPFRPIGEAPAEPAVDPGASPTPTIEATHRRPGTRPRHPCPHPCPSCRPPLPAPQTPAPQTPAPQTPAPQTPAPRSPAPQTPMPLTPMPRSPAHPVRPRRFLPRTGHPPDPPAFLPPPASACPLERPCG